MNRSTVASQLRDERVHLAVASPKPAEIEANVALLREAGLMTDSTRIAYCGLWEPDKHELLGSLKSGVSSPRRLRTMLLNRDTGEERDVVTDVTAGTVVSDRVLDVRVDGRVPVLISEMTMVESIVHADERWREAMRRRGLTDLTVLRVNPLSAGVDLTPDEQGRRFQRCFTFVQKTPDDLPWAHPVDGVTAVVDVISRTVIEVIILTNLTILTFDEPLMAAATTHEAIVDALVAGDGDRAAEVLIAHVSGYVPGYTAALPHDEHAAGQLNDSTS